MVSRTHRSLLPTAAAAPLGTGARWRRRWRSAPTWSGCCRALRFTWCSRKRIGFSLVMLIILYGIAFTFLGFSFSTPDDGGESSGRDTKYITERSWWGLPHLRAPWAGNEDTISHGSTPGIPSTAGISTTEDPERHQTDENSSSLSSPVEPHSFFPTRSKEPQRSECTRQREDALRFLWLPETESRCGISPSEVDRECSEAYIVFPPPQCPHSAEGNTERVNSISKRSQTLKWNSTVLYDSLPHEAEDQPKFREVPQDYDSYVDSTLVFSRNDFLHTPIISHVGLETFAGLRLTATSNSSTFISLEERHALEKFKHQCQTKNERGSLSAACQQFAVSDTLRTPLEGMCEGNLSNADHTVFRAERLRYSLFFTPAFNHLTSPSHRSLPNASAPALAATPVSEVLPRMIHGDELFDELAMQLLDRHLVCERGVAFMFRNHFCDRFVQLMHLPQRSPLVVHVYKAHAFHFVLRCVYLRHEALRTATRKFVLLGTEIDEASAKSFFMQVDMNPNDFPNVTLQYFLNHPLLAHWYSTNGNIRHVKFTSLPIGMQFYHRSGNLLPDHEEQQRADQLRNSLYTSYALANLSLALMFPHRFNTTGDSQSPPSPLLRFGSLTTMWLERAVELFAGSTLNPPVKIIPLDQLPERITTFYVVLMPIEPYQREDRPSLTDELIVFEEANDSNYFATAPIQHIALLPYTVALYHKLRQRNATYGAPWKQIPAIAAFTVWPWRQPWFDTLNQTSGLGILAQEFLFEGFHQEHFYELMMQHAFVASPPGKGYECFRTWEAMAFGGIPILQHPILLQTPEYQKINPHHIVGTWEELRLMNESHPQNRLDALSLLEPYRDLPVVVVRNITDVSVEYLKVWQQEIHERAVMGKYKIEKLFMQYWVDLVYGHTNNGN